MEKLVIGCDDAAFELKEQIKDYLKERFDIIDCGVHDESPVLYPDVAITVAEKIANKEAKRGLLFCGTGIGMAMSANKVPGIRAAQCHDVFSAERAAMSNDAHIITLGARVIGIELAKKIIDTWLDLHYVDSPSGDKIRRMMEYDTKYRVSGSILR